MGASSQGGRKRSFSRSIAQFIPRQDPESASLHSKGEGSDLQSNESCIYLGLKEQLQLDVHMRNKCESQLYCTPCNLRDLFPLKKKK